MASASAQELSTKSRQNGSRCSEKWEKMPKKHIFNALQGISMQIHTV